jgi:hypothetical protein
METLQTLTAAVELLIENPDVSTSEIHSMLNRGVLFIAGGATRDYNVPTIPPLPKLAEDFTVNTVVGSNRTNMPVEFHRWAFLCFNSKGDAVVRTDSLNDFKRHTQRYIGKAGDVKLWCLWGDQFYYSQTPLAPEPLTVCGYRKPIEMVADNDIPDGIPEHLVYNLLTNYCAMMFLGEVEQDLNGPGYSFGKYTLLFQQALTDLHSFIPKDEPSVFTPIDSNTFLSIASEV